MGAQTSSQMAGGVTKAWPGMGSVSTQSSPTHLALQPAYSSPHVYSSQANIYAEVETDYEMDSGFTEESVSDSLGDKKEDGVYNNYTNSSCSSEAGPYLREVAHSQGRLGFGPGHSRAPVTMTVLVQEQLAPEERRWSLIKMAKYFPSAVEPFRLNPWCPLMTQDATTLQQHGMVALMVQTNIIKSMCKQTNESLKAQT